MPESSPLKYFLLKSVVFLTRLKSEILLNVEPLFKFCLLKRLQKLLKYPYLEYLRSEL